MGAPHLVHLQHGKTPEMYVCFGPTSDFSLDLYPIRFRCRQGSVQSPRLPALYLLLGCSNSVCVKESAYTSVISVLYRVACVLFLEPYILSHMQCSRLIWNPRGWMFHHPELYILVKLQNQQSCGVSSVITSFSSLLHIEGQVRRCMS